VDIDIGDDCETASQFETVQSAGRVAVLSSRVQHCSRPTTRSAAAAAGSAAAGRAVFRAVSANLLPWPLLRASAAMAIVAHENVRICHFT
jgi:ADP-ribosylglycohydrolase